MTPFNIPYLTGNEAQYIAEAMQNLHLSGDGSFTHKCQEWLEKNLVTPKALLTHSCTAALEMAALLIDIKPGDEVIMPSFTFVSTANAFVLRGAVPVFVDIRLDTLNIDEELIEDAITEKTRAIVPVHYAGVPCEMDKILAIAKKHNLYVIEDAAQAILSKYKNKYAGTIGHIGTLSFHATKNIQCGEGGAILINDPSLIERAEIIREKGTDRKKFFRGEIDKYTWKDIGSSYLPSELTAAFLHSQLESSFETISKRLHIWNAYKDFFSSNANPKSFATASLPSEIEHNAHIFFLVFNTPQKRQMISSHLEKTGIKTAFHYTPLHRADNNIKKIVHGKLANTDLVCENILRLPVYPNLNHSDVINELQGFIQTSDQF